ncbi:exopolysaccharide biosynthesis protein [Pararhodospirillum photometricum]|uniref:Exopolysaccharide synthesis, ExoD n=1 Tax=Pararhodospirillum photometricum DSM 122 TaxID=1150469 RepID=H6SJV9_PARPM|nr:exopolysaccharide biosynthesis protein [Pararhodospirillum photometricum]CCG08274.1 Exopolysaccharide synthesis, ExoD [Pararhodospirillum photometricum DSM 122]
MSARVPADPPTDADPRPRTPTSQLLEQFITHWEGERVCLQDLVEALGDRGYGFFLLIFAFPNVLPSPVPGISAVLGIPLILVAGQLMMGSPAPWFPRVLGERSLATKDLARMIAVIVPWLRRLERLFKPRLRWLTFPLAERLLAAFCAVLAVVLILPIPLGNMPPGLSVSLIALGLIEHDGLTILIGLLVGLLALGIVVGVAAAFLAVLPLFLESFFH